MQTGGQMEFSPQFMWEYLRGVSDWRCFAEGYKMAGFPCPHIPGHLEIPPYKHQAHCQQESPWRLPVDVEREF